MNATSALAGNAATAPPPPAPSTSPGAPAGDAPAEGEVLSMAELLRLLEQGEALDPALARAGAPVQEPAATAATAGGGAHRDDAGDAPQDDEAAPCDVVTLLRLLEQPAAQAAAAAAAATLAGAAPTPIAAAGAPVAEDATAAAAPRPRVPLGTGTGTTAVAGAGQSPLVAAARPDGGEAGVLAAAVAQVAADAAAGERSGTQPASTAATAGTTASPSADPAQLTLGIAQSFRSEMPTSPPVERVVHVPVRDPAWPQAVAAEIQFLADQKVESATLRLSPEHLGPLEVRIDVRDGNVSVAFGVAHVDTQTALEQALPRLREMFAAAGLQLGQASVQQEARRGSHNGSGAPAAGAAAADNAAGAGPAGVHALGLVDDYA